MEQNTEQKILEAINSNENFIKLNSKLNKKIETICSLAQAYITNTFYYLILNRLYRTKIKFKSTKYLDNAVKNINLFFLVWDNILDKEDYLQFNRKSLTFYAHIPNELSIKNFTQVGLAIDQLNKLYVDIKNIQQLVDFKRRNLLLVLALIDHKKMYIESDPASTNSKLSRKFIELVKKETLEYSDMELSYQSMINVSKPHIRPITDLIVFGEHMINFSNNLGEQSFTESLRKKIDHWKKYQDKLNKFKNKD